MAYLVKSEYGESERLERVQLSHIPGVWNDDWTPNLNAIDYLILRGTGRRTHGGYGSDFAALQPLSASAILAVGHDLVNFLAWCEARQIAIDLSVSPQIATWYRDDMSLGQWSLINPGKPLSLQTIKRRTSVCADYLAFLFEMRGVRKIDGYSQHSRLFLGSRTEGQASRPVRQHPSKLRLPTLDETRAWLDSIKDTHGQTPYLLVKLIIGTGLRAEEALCFQEGQLPPIPVGPHQQIKMEICYGTKGNRVPHDIKLRGKARQVRVPIDLLIELHRYKDIQRKLILRRCHGTNQARFPAELFVSEKTGRKLSYKRFWEIWKSGPIPYPEFSPHIGRHMWACLTLRRKIREELQNLSGHGQREHPALKDLLYNLVRIWIGTQLGHVDEKTTEMYLEWALADSRGEEQIASWWDYLNE